MTTTEYKSQSARDAQRMNYGGPSYWAYLDEAAERGHDYFTRHPELGIDPESMFTRSLSEALMGNDGV